jgi:receptor expression-enhancing protein 5/6
MIVNFAGFGYPAYMSFKAIESAGEEDDKQWLTYWVVFAFFNLIETITDVLQNWIPGYFYLKLVGLVLLFHPETKYASVVYDKVIKPNFAKFVIKKGE